MKKTISLSRIYIVMALAIIASAGPGHATDPLDWPTYGPELGHLRVDDGIDRGDGLTNGIPDIVGPVDGSAKLTIFTEGNHYPVLLPLVFDAFPEYCAETERCSITADEITVVTLPQVMIMAGLQSGGFRFGNAQLPVKQDTPVFPDLFMLGERPMGRLNEQQLLASKPRVFAKHRGMGLLINRDLYQKVPDLQAFASSDLPFVFATPRETGARHQYLGTLNALLGEDAARAVFAREVADFPGRVAIQHRDVPYAVMNGIAPVGMIFGHLADFYASYWPDRLAFVEIPEAAQFGSEIAVAKAERPNADPSAADAFLEFLFDAAPGAYRAGGFMSSEDFDFGRELNW
ncbi:substrate-binding domain-containing protein [Algihabitans sp.]|uniref:substrate-binding domain-containing protein n=1 Tax=Algihabitans sp. TaxID=2821514 RepID=UPI003BA90B33